MIQAIVAVDLNWGIGRADALRFRIRDDLRRFRELTLGHMVVYGRKTLMTFPGQKPLSGRINLILSRNPELEVAGATVCHQIQEVLAAAAACPDKHLFVIGGASVYRELFPWCQKIYVTRVHCVCPADCFFPNLDNLSDWVCTSVDAGHRENELIFDYLIYERKHE
jgi:dihydrofolate reductase